MAVTFARRPTSLQVAAVGIMPASFPPNGIDIPPRIAGPPQHSPAGFATPAVMSVTADGRCSPRQAQLVPHMNRSSSLRNQLSDPGFISYANLPQHGANQA